MVGLTDEFGRFLGARKLLGAGGKPSRSLNFGTAKSPTALLKMMPVRFPVCPMPKLNDIQMYVLILNYRLCPKIIRKNRIISYK